MLHAKGTLWSHIAPPPAPIPPPGVLCAKGTLVPYSSSPCPPTPPDVLRAKGTLWFHECSAARYSFHLSGRQRVECRQEGPWDSPPGSQLVIIGSEQRTLAGLEAALRHLAAAWQEAGAAPPATAAPCLSHAHAHDASAATASHPHIHEASTAHGPQQSHGVSQGPHTACQHVHGQRVPTLTAFAPAVGGGQGAPFPSPASAPTCVSASAPAPDSAQGAGVHPDVLHSCDPEVQIQETMETRIQDTVESRIQAHDRFELLSSTSFERPSTSHHPHVDLDHRALPSSCSSATGPPPPGHSDSRSSSSSSSSTIKLVEFSVRGSPLHGIDGHELNAAVMRGVNAAWLGRPGPGGGLGHGLGLLLYGVWTPRKLSANPGMQQPDR